MATPRLTFLWPFLFKPATTGIRQQTARSTRRGVQSTTRKRQQAATQRYGTANEPPPHLIAGKSALLATVKDSAGNQKDTKALTKTNGNGKTGRPKKEKVAKDVPKDEPQEQEGQVVEEAASSEAVKTEKNAAAQPAEILAEVIDGSESSPVSPAPQSPQLPTGNALETVLNMPSSDKDGKAQAPMFQEPTASSKSKSIGDNSPPHISAPLYVHHFDTYGLVKRLEEGGWKQESAITTMKAVRLILAENMDLARAALVSKSNVENETYLFRAACSELLTEINTKRKAEAERSRTDRAQLQHEVDILGQRLTQEGGTLKDDLKGMFDDRKMAIRNEQRSMESKVCRTSPDGTGEQCLPLLDPRTQLPHHRHSELRLPLRRRRRALDHHEARNRRARNVRPHGHRQFEIREHDDADPGRREETIRGYGRTAGQSRRTRSAA